MQEPDGVVNLSDLLELIRVDQFFIIFKLAVMMIVGLFHELLMQEAPV
jgi:hypothetical protein